MFSTHNAGKRWTHQATTKLVHLTMHGTTQREIAKRFARTPKAVECKLRRVKLATVRNVRFQDFAKNYIELW